MKFSSEPPTAALFFLGEIETSRLKYSSSNAPNAMIARLKYHWGQNYYIPFFAFWGIIFGNYYRNLYSMIFLGEVNYCNVMVAAVLHGKPQIIRLQLQFFSRFCVGINYCNVTLLLYQFFSE